MEEIVKKIEEAYNGFMTNVEATKKGNKAAGVRARKFALEMMALSKEYRKASIEATK